MSNEIKICSDFAVVYYDSLNIAFVIQCNYGTLTDEDLKTYCKVFFERLYKVVSIEIFGERKFSKIKVTTDKEVYILDWCYESGFKQINTKNHE